MKKLTTYEEIENLCEAMIKDFLKCKHYTNSHCMDIEAFVTEYLGVAIVYETFAEPDPGRIGFLADGKHAVWVNRKNETTQIVFPADTAVIDKFLQRPDEIARKCFTIAHEGAHFVLNKHAPVQTKAAFHNDYDGEMVYSPELLREMMSFQEAFANRASACLLMPRFLVERVLKKYNGAKRIVAYDNYVMDLEQKLIVKKMADIMGVNYFPLLTRLKELELFEMRPIENYLRAFKNGGDTLS